MASINRFRSLRIKKTKLIEELRFLLLCRSKKIFPKFVTKTLRIQPNKYHIRKCIPRIHLSLLRAAIKDTRSSLAKCEIELYQLHQNLAYRLHPIFFNAIDAASNNNSCHQKHRKRTIINKKLHSLTRQQAKPHLNSTMKTKLSHASHGKLHLYPKKQDTNQHSEDTIHKSASPTTTLGNHSNSNEAQKITQHPQPTRPDNSENTISKTSPPPTTPTNPPDTNNTQKTLSQDTVNQCTKNTPTKEETISPQQWTPKNCNVSNLSNHTFSTNTIAALNLGLNFSLPPRRNAIMDSIATLNASIARHSKPEDLDSTLHTLSACILKNEHLLPHKTHNTNFLNQLKPLISPDITVSRSDKGNNIVILDTDHYKQATNTLLSDQNTYTLIKNNPLPTVVRNASAAIKSCSSICETTLKKLHVSNPRLPSFYALPKIHKPTLQFRPVISNIGSVSHPIARHALSKINFLRNNCTHITKNSIDFSTKIRNINIQPTDILASVDVVSLFTSIPTNEAITCLENKLNTNPLSPLNPVEKHDTINMIKFCLNNNFFIHDNTFYKQHNGLAMGSPLSSCLADIFMDKLETSFLNDPNILKPKAYFRYVDDIFIVWPHGIDNLHKFISHINNLHNNIKFTLELEKNNTLPFLDVLIERKNQSLHTSVFRKPFSAANPPHALSCHPWQQKSSAFFSYLYRAYRISSSNTSLNLELQTIKEIALARGYNEQFFNQIHNKVKNKIHLQDCTTLTSLKEKPKKIACIPYIPKISHKIAKLLKSKQIHTVYKPHRKISHLFTNHKNKTPNTERSGIYSIPCSDCPKIYIGQTSRQFKKRQNEHQNFTGYKKNKIDPNKVIRPEKSAIAQHRYDTGHNIDFENGKIIKQCNKFLLDSFEQLYIHTNRQHLLNKATDNILHKAWKNLTHLLN